MKRLIFFVLIMAVGPSAYATVSARVCLADGNTPLELADPCIPFVYRPIMTGTHLTIIIDSNEGVDWAGGLYIADPYRDYGVLFGRNYNEMTLDWEGSHLEAAGLGATVWGQEDTFKSGFELATGTENIIPGDWFIIDYNATNVGGCNVSFYDYAVSEDPIYDLSFTQVPSRDFDDDGIVNFKDFGLLCLSWRRTDCQTTENCSGTDLDENGNVDFDDLKQFADFWLERTR
mgnify:CR=1 FL=1